MSANFYEFLGVSTTASADEIRTMLDEKYRAARNLVNHHQFEVANQASQDLHMIEQARTTLLDPVRRATYDAQLGGVVVDGGLADPQATPVMVPPAGVPVGGIPIGPGSAGSVPSVVGERLDAWICPTCHTANPIGTAFCKKDGTALAKQCPNCNSLIEASASFCMYCGVNVEAALRAREQERIQAEQQAQLVAIQQAELKRQQEAEKARLGSIMKESNNARNFMVGAGCSWFIPYLNFVLVPAFLGLAIFNAYKARSHPQMAGDTKYRQMANLVFILGMVMAGLIVLGLCILGVTALVNSVQSTLK